MFARRPTCSLGKGHAERARLKIASRNPMSVIEINGSSQKQFGLLRAPSYQALMHRTPEGVFGRSTKSGWRNRARCASVTKQVYSAKYPSIWPTTARREENSVTSTILPVKRLNGLAGYQSGRLNRQRLPEGYRFRFDIGSLGADTPT